MKLDPRNPISNLFIPRYNAITLFLMSLAFVLIFCTNAELRTGFHDLFFENKLDPRIYIAFCLFVAGILFSLYHVFTARKRTDWEKIAMLFFAVFVNVLSGIAAGMHVLKDTYGVLVIFPVWNIINGVLLLIMYRLHIIDESSIVDDYATSFQVLLGSIVVVTALVACRFIFAIHWSITFSICVSYATNINRTFQDFLLWTAKKEHRV